MTGRDKGAVLKLLADVGAACKRFHDTRVMMVETKRIQCDEIWSFCYAKDKNTSEDMKGVFGIGDVWTWTAIDADTKLMVSYNVDRRDERAARRVMEDLASRFASRVQLTTDGLRVLPDRRSASLRQGNRLRHGQQNLQPAKRRNSRAPQSWRVLRNDAH